MRWLISLFIFILGTCFIVRSAVSRENLHTGNQFKSKMSYKKYKGIVSKTIQSECGWSKEDADSYANEFEDQYDESVKNNHFDPVDDAREDVSCWTE